MRLTAVDWILLILYLVGVAFIGVFFSKKQTTTDEYFLGGRRFGSFTISLSILGTGLSAISFLGVPAFVIAKDWSSFFASLMGLPATLIVAWFFIPFFYNLKLTSTYDYLKLRFDTKVATLAGILFFLLRGLMAGIAIYAPSIALCAVTGWNLNLCILISGVMTVLYTALGGMSAVVWTDVMQVVVLFVGAGFVMWTLGTQLPGGPMDWIADAARQNKFNLMNFKFSWVEQTFWASCIGGFFYNLAFYGVDQVLVQRYMAADSLTSARRSLYLNAIYTLPSGIIFFVIGTMLFLFMQKNPGHFPAGATAQEIFPLYMLHGLPAGWAGVLIAAIYAAAMSTLSSVLNSLATVSVNDFYRRFWRKQETDEHYVKVGKQLTTAWGILAIFVGFLAIYIDSNVWMGAVKAGSLFMGPMLGMFLLGMFSDRPTSKSAFIGCVVGLIFSMVVGYGTELELFWLTLFGTIVTMVVGAVVCTLSPPTAAERSAARPFTYGGALSAAPTVKASSLG